MLNLAGGGDWASDVPLWAGGVVPTPTPTPTPTVTTLPMSVNFDVRTFQPGWR